MQCPDALACQIRTRSGAAALTAPPPIVKKRHAIN
jgi:hypothetical protein